MKDWREELLNTMYDTQGCFFKEYEFQKNATNDHEHCSICFKKIGDFEGIEKNGYYCTKTEDWLCKECFRDFKEHFNWNIEK